MCIIPARCSVYTVYVSSHFSSHWRETSVSLEVSVGGITIMRRRLQWAEAGGQPQCNRGAGTPSSPPDTRFVFTTGTSVLIRDDLESPTSVGPCRFIFHHKFPGFPLSIKGANLNSHFSLHYGRPRCTRLSMSLFHAHFNPMASRISPGDYRYNRHVRG